MSINIFLYLIIALILIYYIYTNFDRFSNTSICIDGNNEENVLCFNHSNNVDTIKIIRYANEDEKINKTNHKLELSKVEFYDQNGKNIIDGENYINLVHKPHTSKPNIAKYALQDNDLNSIAVASIEKNPKQIPDKTSWEITLEEPKKISKIVVKSPETKINAKIILVELVTGITKELSFKKNNTNKINIFTNNDYYESAKKASSQILTQNEIKKNIENKLKPLLTNVSNTIVKTSKSIDELEDDVKLKKEQQKKEIRELAQKRNENRIQRQLIEKQREMDKLSGTQKQKVLDQNYNDPTFTSTSTSTSTSNNSGINTNSLNSSKTEKLMDVKCDLGKYYYLGGVRYIRIEQLDNSLHIAEIKVINYFDKNIAQYKPASQSSVYLGADGNRAVDGNVNGLWSQRSVMHTTNLGVQWLEIDLEKEESVKEIHIYNRFDCCFERLDNAKIKLLNKDKLILKQIDYGLGSQDIVDNAKNIRYKIFDVNIRIQEGASNSCMPCPINTYMDETNHKNQTCKSHTKCPPGKYLINASETEAGECVDCPDNTFTDKENNQIKKCREQVKCRKGSYLKDASTTSLGKCEPCPQGTHMSDDFHYNTQCLDHNKCNAGEYLSGHSNITSGNCVKCPENTYINESNHTQTQCKENEKCLSGKVLVGATNKLQGSCQNCPENTYISDTNHRNKTCTPQPKCTSGKFLSNSSSSKKGSCQNCPTDTYVSDSSHSRTACITQPNCSSGKFLNNPNASRRGNCQNCPANTYISNSSHKKPQCLPQPTCNSNQYLKNSSSSRQGTCTSIPNCSNGKYRTGKTNTSPGSCVNQPNCGEFKILINADPNRKGICKPGNWSVSDKGRDLHPTITDDKLSDGGKTFSGCAKTAAKNGRNFFAWTDNVYNPGFCKIIKSGKTPTDNVNKNYHQGYDYKLYEHAFKELKQDGKTGYCQPGSESAKPGNLGNYVKKSNENDAIVSAQIACLSNDNCTGFTINKKTNSYLLKQYDTYPYSNYDCYFKNKNSSYNDYRKGYKRISGHYCAPGSSVKSSNWDGYGHKNNQQSAFDKCSSNKFCSGLTYRGSDKQSILKKPTIIKNSDYRCYFKKRLPPY